MNASKIVTLSAYQFRSVSQSLKAGTPVIRVFRGHYDIGDSVIMYEEGRAKTAISGTIRKVSRFASSDYSEVIINGLKNV